MTTFSSMLRLYCRVNHIEVRGLAEEIGVSYATISRIMNGKPMSQDTFIRVINWMFYQKQNDQSGEEV